MLHMRRRRGPGTVGLLLGLFLLLRLLLGGGTAAAAAAAGDNKQQQQKLQQPPNFVLFLADNLGYADIGCLRETTTEATSRPRSRTPHIDRLAAQGLTLEHWNSAAHLCSASRAALLTGRYPVRDGIYPGVFHADAALGLSNATPTLASLLHARGYATSIVGKWHLGHARPEFLPTSHGFDEWLGIPYHMSGGSLDEHICYRDGNDDDPPRRWLPLYANESIVEQPVQLETLADRYVQQARTFLQRHAVNPNAVPNVVPTDDFDSIINATIKHNNNITPTPPPPFFLYLPFSHVHQLCAPRHLPEPSFCQWTADPTRQTFADAVQEMDWIAGQVMQALHDFGLSNNTLVLFTADNGPWVAEQACSGSKGKFTGQWLMDHGRKNSSNHCTACPHDYIPDPTNDQHAPPLHRCLLPGTSQYLKGVPCGHDSGLGSLWEANLRMPAFAWWPHHIVPGRVTNRTVSTLDVLPTLLSLAQRGQGSPQQQQGHQAAAAASTLPELALDGQDVSSILLDQAETPMDEEPDDRVLFFWRDGFASGPLPAPYGRVDVAALKIGHLKFWFWTKSGHYNDDPHVYHDPPLVFDIAADPAEAVPLHVADDVWKHAQRLRDEHMRDISWGPPLTLAHNESLIPCVNSDTHCRTDGSPQHTSSSRVASVL
jgi:arylsulfatase A-like enzyme